MLAIARALVVNPNLLLLDEPMEGLAPIIVQDLMKVIRNLVSEGGMAVVVVEQHAKLALTLTRQALVLDRGRVVHRGPSDDLLGDPQRCIGSLPSPRPAATTLSAVPESPHEIRVRSGSPRVLAVGARRRVAFCSFCSRRTRPEMFILWKMLCAWVLTVMSLMPSLRPISCLVMPRRIQETISFRRGESCAAFLHSFDRALCAKQLS